MSYRLIKPTAVFLASLFIAACSTRAGYFVSGVIDQAPSYEIKTDELNGLMYYTFQTGGRDSEMTVFFISGSGCTSLQYYLKPYFSELKGDIKIYALQKRDLGKYNTGLLNCGDEYHRSNFFEQWVKDQQQFVRKISSAPDVEKNPIVLFGVSEGGNVAAAVAASTPSVTHLAVLGSGGMKQIDELKLLFEKDNLEADVDGVFREISRDSDNISRTAYGQTYKYWNSVAYVDPMKYYSRIQIPILVGAGRLDKSVPVESALYLRNTFHGIGKDNLLLCVYRDADHTLTGRNGRDYKPHFFHTLVGWVRATTASAGEGVNGTSGDNPLSPDAKPGDKPFVHCD